MLAPPGVPGPSTLVGSLARAAVIATLFQLVTAFCAIAHRVTSTLSASSKVARAAVRLSRFIVLLLNVSGLLFIRRSSALIGWDCNPTALLSVPNRDHKVSRSFRT